MLLGLGPVKNRESKEMLVPFNGSGEATAPVARVVKAALERASTHDPLERRSWSCRRSPSPARSPRRGSRSSTSALIADEHYGLRGIVARKRAIALDVSSSASHSTVCPPGTVTTSEQVPECVPVAVEELVVREVRVRPEHEQRRDSPI